MTLAVFAKLLAMFAAVAVGWLAARSRWLGADAPTVATVVSSLAFSVFVPALLFRTMVRLDVAALPWHTLAAYFVPAVGCVLLLLAVLLLRRRTAARHGGAAPAVRTLTAVYGNALQLGLPMSAALFGEAGLALHVTLVSVHGLVLLTLLTVVAEAGLARRDPRATLLSTAAGTVRNAVVHPVVLPVLAGLAWNLAGLGLPDVLDETLATLGSAVVPVCLVLIGVSLAAYDVRGNLRGALLLSVLKLLVLPAVVLAVARFGFGVSGTSLSVLVMLAALPSGSNALVFAQRYATLEAEATAAIVVSTLAFCVTAAFWLAVLAAL